MELTEWLTIVSRELGIDDLVLDEDAVHTLLDLARDSAHEIERVAAPLTTFLVGVAVGRGAQLAEVSAQASALALNTSGSPESGGAAT